jgi:tRNA(fMet)-specific endonuclease VapC
LSYLLDTDICSFHLRKKADLFHRLIQHSGRLFISTISLGELYTWAFRQNTDTRLASISHFSADLHILDFDEQISIRYGQTRAQLLDNGLPVSANDLLIASVALAHDLTLVTHNTKDFENIPNLRVEDWLSS